MGKFLGRVALFRATKGGIFPRGEGTVRITELEREALLEAELFGYATAIRSLSRGRASYSMEPAHFERVPKQVQDKIVEKK